MGAELGKGRRVRRCLTRCGGLLLAVQALSLSPTAVPAQAGNTAEAALGRALDLEGANKCREAIPLYRQAVGVEDPTGAVLGLERCYSMVGRPDSLLPLLDTLIARKPKDPTLRTIQLRTLSTVRRDAELAVAFAQWTSISPKDPTPYRIYAQVLLDEGRARGADTVLQAAAEALGGTRDVAAEFAQMQAALGLWVKNDKRHGYGKMTFKNGSTFSGNYIEDERDGKGIYKWYNGDNYIGEYRKNKRNGLGKLYQKEDNVFEEGIWKDGNCIECILGVAYSTPLFVVIKDNKTGYINEKGEIIVPFQYDVIIRTGLYQQELPNFYGGRIAFSMGGKMGLLDDKGAVIVEAKYKAINNFINGYALVQTDRIGSIVEPKAFINIFGKEVIPGHKLPPESQTIDEARTVIWMANYSKVYVGIGDTVFRSHTYNDAAEFSLGLAPVQVKKGDKYGYINKDFSWAIEPRFLSATPFFKEGVACVKFENSWGLIDTKGTVIAKDFDFDPADYLGKGYFFNGLMSVRKKNGGQHFKYGFMNAKGELAIALKYDFADGYGFPSDGLAVVNEGSTGENYYAAAGGNWMLIDKKGNVQKTFGSTYDVVYNFSEGIAIVKKDKKYGYINMEGKEILPPIYEEKPERFYNGLGRFYLPGKIDKPFGYVNKEGKIIWEASL